MPDPDTLDAWDGPTLAGALRHDPSESLFNPSLRQTLHVGYRVAAEMGRRYLDALDADAATIAEHVRENLYERHARPLFIGAG